MEMKKKAVWLVIIVLIVMTLLITSCNQTDTEEEGIISLNTKPDEE
ncbi:MAG: hypothetical protein PHQ86_05575 [Dehalococcoidales bacterium]|nr:hypothetical protein [Dehalococcoidales bacterium]